MNDEERHKEAMEVPVRITVEVSIDEYLPTDQVGVEEPDGPMTADAVLDSLISDSNTFGLADVLVKEWCLVESGDFEVKVSVYDPEARVWSAPKSIADRIRETA